MKLNLQMFSEVEPESYTNISPIFDVTKKRINSSLHCLDEIVDDGTVDHILAIHVLEYLGVRSVESVKNWINKLTKDGEATIVVTNPHEVARQFVLGVIDINTFNRHIHDRGKVQSFDIHTLKALFHECGAKIKGLRTVGLTIEATLGKSDEKP